VNELQQRLVKHGLSIKLNQKAKLYLLEHGYDSRNGVRPLRRLIQDTLEDQIADEVLKENYKKGDVIEVSVKKNKLDYNIIHE